MYSIVDILFLMGLGFSLAAPLGPVNMEMIKRSIQTKFGFILGIFTGLGAMTGDFLIATAVLFVGDQYLKDIINDFWVYIILLGSNVFILTYIGISALRAPAPTKEEFSDSENEPVVEKLRSVKQYGTGFIIVVTSPWSYFWWTSFGGYILNSGLPLGSAGERFIVTLFFLSGILFWIILLCGVLGISRELASPKILNAITKGSALLILGFAIKILYDGIIFLGIT